MAKEEEPGLYQDFHTKRPAQSGIKKAAMEDYGNAPGWIWVQQFGGSGGDIGRAITSDAIGNIYVAGNFSGTISIGSDTLHSQGKADMLIMKLSQTGYPLWFQHVPASDMESVIPIAIHLDNDNNILVTGCFDQPGINMSGTQISRIGDQDIFIAKYSNSGSFLWANSHGESEKSMDNPVVRSDADNNYYLTCQGSLYYSVLLKYNAAGQLQTANQLSGCRIVDVEINGDRLYYIGDISNFCDFGNGVTLYPNSQPSLFLAKSDLFNNFTWAIGGEYDELTWGMSNGIDLAIRENGDIVLVGFARNNFIWDGDTMDIPNLGVMFLSVVSSEGQVNWTNTTDGDGKIWFASYSRILLDNQNNTYLFGRNFSGDSLFYQGKVIYPGEYVLKCDPDGNALWSKNLENYNIGSGSYKHSLQMYGSDKFILASWEEGNLAVFRFNSDVISENIFSTSGNSGSGSINGLETDSSANLYVYGDVYDHAELFGMEIEDGEGAFLSKLNSRGEVQWIEFINGGNGPSSNLGQPFLLNEEYNILYLVGRINDTLEIGPEKLYAENGDAFLASYSSDGTFGWVRQFAGLNSYSSISTDHSGNVILCGDAVKDVSIGDSSFHTYGLRYAFVAKFDINGAFKWAFPVTGSDIVYDVFTSTDKNDMIYLSGEALPGVINFNGTDIDIQGDSEGDVMFARLDPDGNLLWFKTFGKGGGRTSTFPNNIISDQDGYSYLYGWYYDTVYFDDWMLATEYKGSGTYIMSYFVAKINPSGDALWVKSIHERDWDFNYNEIDLDEAGNIYVMANFKDTLLFGDDFTLVNSGEKDIFIAKYYNNGDLAWVKSIESTAGTNQITGLAVYDSMSLYTGGYFSDRISFDQEVVETSGQNGFIALLSPGQLNCDDFSVEILTVSDITCNSGQDGSAHVVVTNGLDPINYLWDDDEMSDSSFVTNLQANRYYHVTASDAMGCVTQDSIKLSEPDPIEISKTFSDLVCPGETDGYIDLTISGGTEPYIFVWSNGSTTEDLSGLKPGKYYFDAVDSKSCAATDTIVLDSSIVYQGSELCLVTVNNQNKIIIVWEKEPDVGIVSYKIYREQSKDNYIYIHEQAFDDLSIYVDEASAPEEFAHYYKIKAVDACGNESKFSPYHKSIKLYTSVGINKEVTLNWEAYEGFDYAEYKIFRGHTLNDLYEIRTISSNSKSWTDPNPPTGLVYYRVEVVKEEPCFPTMFKAEEYGSTVSNFDEETIESVHSAQDQLITIYPNPFNNTATLEFPNPENQPYQLILTDLTGKVMRTMGQITGSQVDIDRGNLSPGTYIIELRGTKIYRTKLLIE